MLSITTISSFNSDQLDHLNTLIQNLQRQIQEADIFFTDDNPQAYSFLIIATLNSLCALFQRPKPTFPAKVLSETISDYTAKIYFEILKEVIAQGNLAKIKNYGVLANSIIGLIGKLHGLSSSNNNAIDEQLDSITQQAQALYAHPDLAPSPLTKTLPVNAKNNSTNSIDLTSISDTELPLIFNSESMKVKIIIKRRAARKFLNKSIKLLTRKNPLAT